MSGREIKLREALQWHAEHKEIMAGWRLIILLPFNGVWQVMQTLSVIYTYIIVTSFITYDINFTVHMNVCFVCDFLYAIDITCSLIHYALRQESKFKNFQPWPWYLLAVDIFTVIPFQAVYRLEFVGNKGIDLYVWKLLHLNAIGRIYRVYFYFRHSTLWIRNVAVAYICGYLVLFIYGFFLAHAASCIIQFLKTREDLERCPSSSVSCFLVNEMDGFCMMSHRYIGDGTIHNTSPKRIACSFFLTIGYFYMFGILLPFFTFTCLKRSRTFFDFWNRYQRFRMFVSNVVEEKELKQKTLDKFRVVWMYGRGDDEPEMLRTFPLNLQKNVYSDLYWDLMRHSDFLRDLSPACKRSLAMVISGDFYLAGDTFWNIGEVKDSLLYVASGILQIMAEENSQSPILSFSGGTVLGESTLFHATRSKAILRVATFSEIHVLRSRDFFTVIQDYPEDKKNIWRNQKLRIVIAKMTQLRKNSMSSAIFHREVTDTENDCVKWIKARLRDFNETESINLIIRKGIEARTAFSHTSVYLPLLNLGEEFEFLNDLMCIKTSLPWVMDPNSHFIRSWAKLIALFTLLICCLYPAFVAFRSETPRPIILLSHFTTFLFFVDIIVQISTAVKTKNGLIVKSGAILLYRMKSLAFFADIIAAIPLNIILFQFQVEEPNKHFTRLSILISLFKSYRVVLVLNEWVTVLTGEVSVRVMVKYLILNCVLLYWSIALLQMLDVECMFGPCANGTWYKPEKEVNESNYKIYAAAFFAMAYLMDVPSPEQYSHNYPSVILISLTLSLMLYLTSAWIGEYTAAYMLERTQLMTYRNLLQSMKAFMRERKVKNRIMRRVLDNMYFQWYYDSGDYLTQERSMLEDAPLKLKIEIQKSTIFQVIKSCDVFEEENEDFIWYLCRKGYRMAVPADSIIVNYGIQTMVLYIVHKGYVQLNSFIPQDARSGMAPAIFRGPGTMFPVVIAMSQMPSCIVARTLTDCDLIVIQLEDLVRGLLLYSNLKDYVDAVKELDTRPILQSRLTLSYIVRPVASTKVFYWKPFTEYGVVGYILWLILMRTFIRPNGQLLIAWETFRLLTITALALFWPSILITTDEFRMGTVYFLITLESLIWIDIYIRMHVAFYDENRILITHPLRTCLHYFSTTCLLDLLNTLPFFHSVVFLLNDPGYNMDQTVVIIHTLFWLLSLHRFALYILHREHIGAAIRYRRTLGIILLGVLIVHSIIEMRMNVEVEFITLPDGSKSYVLTKDSWIRRTGIKDINSHEDIYFVILYCLMMTIFRTYPFEKTYTLSVLGTELACVIFGFVILFHLNAYISSNRSGSKLAFALYRYHMKSMVRFLEKEQVDDEISQLAVKHFDHEWEKTLGQDLQDVFGRFPHNLEEDAMHPIYRESLLGVTCFTKANEEFHRTLSREFIETHYHKGAVITFEKAVQREIYLVHEGACYVQNRKVILHQGSLFGDLHGTGTMVNDIVARTNTLLLSISSPKYFLILNNFYNTEKAYFDTIKDLEDYIESLFTFPLPEDDNPLYKVKRVESSKFVMSKEADAEIMVEENEMNAKTKIFLSQIIMPKTRLYTILNVVFGLDAALTILALPMIIGLRLASTGSFILVYTLDVIWVMKIIASFRMAYVEQDTDNVISNQKLILKRYMTRLDGFFVDILTVLPIELLHNVIKSYYDKWNDTFWKYCFLLRLLRSLHLWLISSRAMGRLSVGDTTRGFVLFLRHLYSFNFLVAVNLLLATDKRMKMDEYQTECAWECQEAMIWAYLSTLNLYSGTGFILINPSNKLHLAYNIVVAVVSAIEKIQLTGEVLAIINGSLNIKLEKLLKLKFLEKYVSVRDVSPALKRKIMSYGYHLIQDNQAEVTPFFLKIAPYFIRVQIMQDLYMRHLLKCPIFRNLPKNFLRQLSARLDNQVYLSGDVIVEKGDVDGTMYFVHDGQVCSILYDSMFEGLDFEGKMYEVGEHFGLEQGLSLSKPHTDTFRAVTRVRLLGLKFANWMDMRRVFPSAWAAIQKSMRGVIEEVKT